MPHLSNMQGLDTDVGVLLRDLADFLECLGEAELSEEHQSAREALLARSRAALERGLDSPEPYLDMSAGKSLLFSSTSTDETDRAREYANAEAREAQRASLQHYYETFQVFQGDATGKGDCNGGSEVRDLDDVILLYAGFPASQAKSKAAKSGTLLHLKRERKMFAPFNVFWLNRSCWVSLVGSHLLLYGNERESRPYLVLPLSGYKSRAAPNALPRDPRRGEAAFEIYCPGERTFQFAAKSGQEMREWVDAITDSLEPDAKNTRASTFVEILELESNERMCIERVKEEKEKYQDVVIGSPKTKAKEKQKSNGKVLPVLEREKSEESKVELAPALPARTRRLPSLPSQEQIAYEPREELYDEEGLYHRIEDVKAQRDYQNCQLIQRAGQQPRSKLNQNLAAVDLIQETYDDSEVFADKSSGRSDEPTETYDDVQSIVRANDEPPMSYDDVQTSDCNSRTKDKDSKPAKGSSKTSQKRSFLDRVRHRKESLTKKADDKKPKSPAAPPSPSATTPPAAEASPAELELPCYDEVSNLRANRAREPIQPNEGELEEEEYLSPPPPRPIYSRPPTIIKCALPSDEIYDDIASELGSGGCKGCANVDVIKDYPKNGSFLSDLQLSIDREHYQVPRSGHRRVVEPAEEIYDDVTLSESFKSRQRDSPATEKSVWSRLGSGKMRIFDHLARQNSCSEPTDTATEDAESQHTKVKSLQKLISKMENTLGKANKANGVA